MKFALASDLHLVFRSLVLDNEQGADVLILAGDVYEISNLPTKPLAFHYVREFFHDVTKKFRYVLWVAGNHEYYGSYISHGANEVKRWLKDDGLDNVIFLDNESCVIDNVNIHGSTLWTNLNNNNPVSAQAVKIGMNDFDNIKDLTIEKWLQMHHAATSWLESSIKKGKKNIVVTHHHPTFLGTPKEYLGSELNYAYASNLSEMIFENPDINVWCCGHIHEASDYMMYNTRVICNPRGYHGYEQIAKKFQLKIFEV